MPRHKTEQRKKTTAGAGVSRNAIKDIWGARTPYFGDDQWPARVDEHLTDQPDKWVQSACVLCSTGRV